jgi:ribonuclease HI
MKQVIIYTDGACRGNPGPGGWGAFIQFDSVEKKYLAAMPIQQTIKWSSQQQLKVWLF